MKFASNHTNSSDSGSGVLHIPGMIVTADMLSLRGSDTMGMTT